MKIRDYIKGKESDTFCPNCGRIVLPGSRYCSYCGRLIQSSKNVGKSEIKQVQLKCKSCGASVTVDNDKRLMTCPYCGSAELIIYSDDVEIQRLKSNAYRDVEFIKHKINDDISKRKYKIEQDKLQFEIEKEIKKEIKSKKDARAGLIFTIIVFLLPFFVFTVDGLIEKKHENNGEIYLSLHERDFVDIDYSTVKILIEDKGFSNIELKELKDLEKEDADEIGKVYGIMVNGVFKGKGDDTISISDYYFPSEKIIIYYHSLKE